MSADLKEDKYDELFENGRSKRMAQNAISYSDNETVSMIVGAAHMFQITYYLKEGNFTEEFQKAETDMEKWEEEFKQVLEEKL